MSGELIISITSFSPRFSTLPLTLECLLSQTIKPDKVILWIGHQDKEKVTDEMKSFEKRGLEIRFCEDLGPYSKIIHTLERFPDNFIVTADDDVYYWPTWLEELIVSWSGDKKEIVAHRVHEIILNEKGLPEKYCSWKQSAKDNLNKTSVLNFATGVGGVFYPPNSLYKDVLENKSFKKLSPNADDVWLYWMTRLNGSKVKKSGPNKELLVWPGSQKKALGDDNVKKQSNDEKIKNMIKAYGFPTE